MVAINVGNSFKKFSKDLNLFQRSLSIGFGRAVKNIAEETHKSAQKHSPVWTGQFRASWGLSVGSVPSESGHPKVPVSGLEGLPIGGVVPASAAKIRTQNLRFTPGVRFRQIFIYNNSPQAERIERGIAKGHRAQPGAPNGVISIVNLEMSTKVNGILAKFLRL